VPDYRAWRLAALSFAALLSGCGGSGGDGDANIELVGLDARPANATCLAGPAPTSIAVIESPLPVAFPNLTFNNAVGLYQVPGDDSRWFVLEQGGSVRVFDNVQNVANHTEYIGVSVTIGGGEGGLLGLAFHPDFRTNGEVFLSYTFDDPADNPDQGLQSYISRFTAANPDDSTLPNTSREDLLVLDQPASNHNGGGIAFGPDGYLYIGFGDGGGGDDQYLNAQNTDTLLGSMLRLDVDNVPIGASYGIPPDNPFAASSGCGDAGCREIYAWGLRNPWRWSFDRQTGDLWLGDVGQGQLEEVDRIERAGNYGWPEREGTRNYCPSPHVCGFAGLIDPVTEYGRSLGITVTGGYVYRGAAIPELQGRFLFGDHDSGRIWAIQYDNQGNALPIDQLELANNTSLSISSFGEGNDGELYVLDRGGNGRIHQIVQSSGTGTSNPPARLLSATGCVEPGNPSQPTVGMIPFDINVAFWSDNALKQRWMALPDGQTIAVGDDGDWSFPEGSVLMKHFRLGGTLIETRLLKHHEGGEWAGYTYEWNDAGTDATLVIGGKSKTIDDQQWYFPSGSDCLRCHTQSAGRSLGSETAQMNRDVVYPGTGRRAYQLTTLDAIGLFDGPLGGLPDDHARLPDPDDTDNDVTDRARAYLHVNCAQCHRPNGPVPVNIDFRYDTAFAETNLCDVAPTRGDVGIANARRLAPGEPQRSEMLARMSRRDAVAMPPLASNIADPLGVGLIEDWIESLKACP